MPFAFLSVSIIFFSTEKISLSTLQSDDCEENYIGRNSPIDMMKEAIFHQRQFQVRQFDVT